VFGGIRSLVAAQAPQNFATAMERSGVTPAALGSGYIVFFVYSAIIGLFAILLSLAVMRRQTGESGAK
jgi:PAT family beta-lactamase induction signal transducer AmpG